MNCPQCGSEWPDSYKFCASCGRALRATPMQALSSTDPTATYTTQVQVLKHGQFGVLGESHKDATLTIGAHGITINHENGHREQHLLRDIKSVSIHEHTVWCV